MSELTSASDLVSFWLFVAMCFGVFCIGLLLAVIGWCNIEREDVMVVSDQVDRDTIAKYLRLDVKHRDKVDAEISVRLDDD